MCVCVCVCVSVSVSVSVCGWCAVCLCECCVWWVYRCAIMPARLCGVCLCICVLRVPVWRAIMFVSCVSVWCVFECARVSVV